MKKRIWEFVWGFIWFVVAIIWMITAPISIILILVAMSMQDPHKVIAGLDKIRDLVHEIHSETYGYYWQREGDEDNAGG